MSKIDDYNKANRIYLRTKSNIYNALGLDNEGVCDINNDKHLLRLRYSNKHTSDFNSAVLTLHASYGFYGSSSGYSAMDSDTAVYMVKALQKYIEQAAIDAIKLAEEDLLKAKEEAKEEALQVLKEVE